MNTPNNSGIKNGIRYETFLINDSTKPYDFVKNRTQPLEQFYKEVKEMDAKTNMQPKPLDANELRKRRAERLKSNKGGIVVMELTPREQEIMQALFTMGIGRLDNKTYPTEEVNALLYKALNYLKYNSTLIKE